MTVLALVAAAKIWIKYHMNLHEVEDRSNYLSSR